MVTFDTMYMYMMYKEQFASVSYDSKMFIQLLFNLITSLQYSSSIKRMSLNIILSLSVKISYYKITLLPWSDRTKTTLLLLTNNMNNLNNFVF